MTPGGHTGSPQKPHVPNGAWGFSFGRRHNSTTILAYARTMELKTLAELMREYPQGATIEGDGFPGKPFQLLAAPYPIIGGREAVLERDGRHFAAAAVDEPSWRLIEANPAPRTDDETTAAFVELMNRNGLGVKK